MTNFTYENLMMAEAQKVSIGKWKGLQVYACSKNNLKPINGVYWVIYDDSNVIVDYDYVIDQFYAYGTIDRKGNVDTWGTVEKYCHIKENKKYDTVKYEEEIVNKMINELEEEEESAIIGDVAYGIDVDDTLKRARTITVDDLLAGFNYGLDSEMENLEAKG